MSPPTPRSNFRSSIWLWCLKRHRRAYCRHVSDIRAAFAAFAFTETLTGADAVALGLANAALPQADVADTALAAARALAQKAPSALIATKALMRDTSAITDAIAEEAMAFVRQLASPEASAAFAAFAARKKA